MYQANSAFNGLTDQFPKRMFATENPRHGMRLVPQARALELPYIALNSKFASSWLVFDVDYEGAAFAHEDAGLPQATKTIINPENGHAHLAFKYDYVWHKDGDQVCQKAINLLNLIKAAFTTMLKADPSYVGLLSKNPWHPCWKTIDGPEYTLAELAEYIPNGTTRTKAERAIRQLKRAVKRAEGRRNCTLFDDARIEAYAAVKRFSSETEWRSFVLSRCECLNVGGLEPGEVKATAKSVARYVWRNRSRYADSYKGRAKCSPEETKERQQAAAATTNTRRKTTTLERIEAATATLAAAGRKATQAAIAELAGVSVSTVQRSLKNMSYAPPLSDNYAGAGDTQAVQPSPESIALEEGEVVQVLTETLFVDVEEVSGIALTAEVQSESVTGQIEEGAEVANAEKSIEATGRLEEGQTGQGAGRAGAEKASTGHFGAPTPSANTENSTSAAEVVAALRGAGLMALNAAGTGRLYVLAGGDPLCIAAETWTGTLNQIRAVADLPAALQKEILLTWFDQTNQAAAGKT